MGENGFPLQRRVDDDIPIHIFDSSRADAGDTNDNDDDNNNDDDDDDNDEK